MHVTRGILIAFAALVPLGCDEATGPDGHDFEWSGTIAPGLAIELKGVNGDIVASGASGSTALVTATKTGVLRDPAEVYMEVVTHAGGVTICAIYPDVPGQPPNECAPGDLGRVSAQNNDVNVTFTVSLPAGVDLVGTTVNGSVSGTNLGSEAFGTTVNGNVTLATSELATALTVNGTITVAIGSTDWGRDLDFVAVNGNVTVEVPAATNAEARLTTTNGSINSDFALTQVAAGDVRGTIGAGGRLLRLTTVNGNVALERGS